MVPAWFCLLTKQIVAFGPLFILPSISLISLGAGGEGQEKEAGRGGAGGDDIKICIDFAYF